MAWVHRGLAGVGAGTVTFKDGATVLAANVPLEPPGPGVLHDVVLGGWEPSDFGCL